MSYTWSWADYEREKRKAERAAARRQTSSAGKPTADRTRGCDGRAAEKAGAQAPAHVANRPAAPAGVVVPPVRYPEKARQACVVFCGERIAIADAPSGMEQTAARWRGPRPAPMEPPPIPEAKRNQVMCRCGSRSSGRGFGPVPAWFGAKCIERDCPLRSNDKRKAG
jgi:hypothetical protein